MSSISRMPKMTENALETRFNREITDDNEWYDKRLSSVLWNEKPEKNKENTTENNWTITNNTEIKNKEKVSGEFRSQLWSLTNPSFENYKNLTAKWIETHSWVEESKKFWNAGSTIQAWVMSDFITDLQTEKNKIDKKEVEKIKTLQQQINDLSQHTITGWYTDYVDENGKIKKDKVNDFVQYLNNPNISKLLEDNGTTENIYKTQIKDKFWTEIEYKDGKFQVTAK